MRDQGEDRGSGRGCLVWAVVCLVIVVVVGGVGLKLAFDSFGSDYATDEDIVVDDGRMRTTVERLARVQAVLDSLPEYRDTKAESASQKRCYTDSGALAQPSVSRTWTLRTRTSPEMLAKSIAIELRRRGWSVPAKPDRFGDRHLRFETGKGWSAVGSLFSAFAEDVVDEDAVVVEMSIRGARPCCLRESRR